MPRKQLVPLIRLGTKNLPTGQAETRLLPIIELGTDLEEIQAAANWRAPKPAGRRPRNERRNERIVQVAREHPTMSAEWIAKQLRVEFPGLTRDQVKPVLRAAGLSRPPSRRK
jgi:hypothetical protein